MPDSFEEQFPGGSASANAAIRALVEAYDASTRLANEAMRRHGLSPAARQALATLDGAGGSMAPTELAARLLTTPPSVTSLIDTLERRHLVERRRDTDDRRRQLVAITSAGSDLVRQFVPQAVALQTAVMASIPERDRATLIRTLHRITESARALDGDAVVEAVQQRPRRRRSVPPDVASSGSRRRDPVD